MGAQYFLEWEAYRYPEGGTYLGPVDFAFNGPDQAASAKVGPYVFGALRGDALEPDQRNGEFGVNLRWSPEALDGTIGLFYRRYADKLPQALVSQVSLLQGQPLMNTSQYNLVYADNIDLFGISFAKNIGGVSVGSELSYRHNTPLLSKILGIPSETLAAARLAPRVGGVVYPDAGETNGPRGNTMHAVVNALGVIADTPVFDSATWAVELVGSHWLDVTSGEETFNAEGYGGCTFNKNIVRNGVAVNNTPGDKWDGCATKNYLGMGASFTPTWYQVYPGVDLSLPIAYSRGLSGNAATVFGGNQGNGNYSVGLGFDIFQKHRVDLKYIGYFGEINDYGTIALARA